MHRARTLSFAAAALILLATAACQGGPSSTGPGSPSTPILVVNLPTEAPTEPFIVPTDVPVTSTPTYKEFENFNAADFDSSKSAVISNEWLPLTPGMQFVYTGETEDNGGMVPHRLVITVTDLTKVIDGVATRVTFDQDFKAGQMVESELAFYAQDKKGNVWRMGEHPEEYQNGEYIEAPTWFGGIKGSVPGIEMLGNPQVGTRSYSQGWAPSVEFTDRGQVSQLGQQVCVPANCYNDVLIIDETSQSEPGAHQLKLFSRGIGNVKVDWRGADQTQEILELLEMTQLTPGQIAEFHARALQEEQHAYQVSPDVYGQTPPSN